MALRIYHIVLFLSLVATSGLYMLSCQHQPGLPPSLDRPFQVQKLILQTVECPFCGFLSLTSQVYFPIPGASQRQFLTYHSHFFDERTGSLAFSPQYLYKIHLQVLPGASMVDNRARPLLVRLACIRALCDSNAHTKSNARIGDTTSMALPVDKKLKTCSAALSTAISYLAEHFSNVVINADIHRGDVTTSMHEIRGNYNACRALADRYVRQEQTRDETRIGIMAADALDEAIADPDDDAYLEDEEEDDDDETFRVSSS